MVAISKVDIFIKAAQILESGNSFKQIIVDKIISKSIAEEKATKMYNDKIYLTKKRKNIVSKL